MSVERYLTTPDVGSIKRSIVRPIVVFPEPDSPTMPKVLFLGISKETSSTALTYLGEENNPCLIEKYSFRCSICIKFFPKVLIFFHRYP